MPVEFRLEDVHKSFGSNPVLRGVNMEVRRGELVAVVGGSGSGKTTILRHITGHFQPDSGRVLVADHESPGSPLVDLARLDPAGMERLERHWAVVFQGNGLMAGNVYDNIALPLREVQGLEEDAIAKLVAEVLPAVGLDAAKDATDDISDLSGGMAKRVAIACALALDPMLILYDEPTSGLDPHMADQIHDLIGVEHRRTTKAGVPRTTFIITHSKDLLRRLQPRTILLDAGRVAFDGTYPDFAACQIPAARPYFE